MQALKTCCLFKVNTNIGFLEGCTGRQLQWTLWLSHKTYVFFSVKAGKIYNLSVLYTDYKHNTRSHTLIMDSSLLCGYTASGMMLAIDFTDKPRVNDDSLSMDDSLSVFSVSYIHKHTSHSCTHTHIHMHMHKYHHVHIVVSSYTFTLPQLTSPQLGKVATRKFKANVRAGILVCERFIFI